MTDRRTVDTINDDQLSQLYDDLEHAEAELQQHAENESADAAAGSYAQRAERVEAQLTAVADLIADHEGDEWAAHPATAALRRILDGQAPAASCPPAAPETEPNNAAATQATERPTLRERHRAQWLALTDAEQAARIAALDKDDEPAHPARTTPNNPATSDGTPPVHTGVNAENCPACKGTNPDYPFICPGPDAEQPARTTPDNPPTSSAWTPPPPGDRREQLPDHLLALLDIPPYTSTACETAELLAAAIARHPEHADELRQWEQRQRQRCRINNKYTGVNCQHLEAEDASPPA